MEAKSHQHTNATPRYSECLHADAGAIDLHLNKAQRDLSPPLATLHHHRLLWKLLVPQSLWKWTYCFL